MYRCIIIDDEPIAIRVIRNHLSAFTDFEVVAECNNALEAMPVLQKENIDLLFCDIQMPQITGVDFIRSLLHPPKVIFTTAYRDYAIDAFELNVVDYLLKPISFERFTKAINHFLELQTASPISTPEAQETRDFIFLKADKKHHKINLTDILYFESLGDYVIAHTNEQKIVTKERISHLADLLPAKRFLQIHRGYIVSIDKIESIGAGFVEIKGKKLPIGRNYKPDLQKLLS
ncbi:two component transcriptional regulator, LytTR family [Draconibacterium orientale]|uniref:Chemotaxis protein CheY n=1 Tax=Draconibacterium orientale TaxID=1168034 RepID=X5DE15_9BACT|nr:LytTR family DNA-binding domain-containing protein [Draconibacterium orientale]AHW59239.1 chemotaxis protein CheY [Draconibacterium orientale]SET22765.1 two component transcriptional regulator, LytTR family [Draconibacterium orientale]